MALPDCIEHPRRPNNVGYVTVRNPLTGKPDGAHRVAWQAANGEIPPGAHVLHRCDNPRCVNPDHLFLGDAKANARDRQAKGRTRIPPHVSRFTSADVLAMRIDHEGGRSQSQIAATYGIDQAHVSRLIRGLTGPLKANGAAVHG